MSRTSILPRRIVLSGLAALPLAAIAQPTTKAPRIGILGNQDNPPWDGLRQGLRDLGYVEGRNVAIDWRWTNGVPDRQPALVRELISLRPDVIVTSGTQAALAAKQATRSIPIVMVLAQNPEKHGLVESLARPGGNVTGLSTIAPQLIAKRLELLRELAPQASRVAVLWNEASPSERPLLKDWTDAAAAARVTIVPIAARTPDELPAAFAEIVSHRAQALIAHGNPVAFKGRQQIADFARSQRLPSVFDEQLFVEAGGLVSYGPSFVDMFRRAAGYVDRILRGAKPADLPVEQPVKFELVINRKTAASIGLAIPPAVLLRADRVID